MPRQIILMLLAIVLVSASASAADKPNVLFILIDDLRPELGCYGNAQIQTPNIDALAKTSVLFERAYCQYPLCNPSRTSMLTGRYPTTTGVLDNAAWFGKAHPDWVSLPHYFKNNGYASLRTGKVFHGGLDDVESWTTGAEKRDVSTGTKAPKKKPSRAHNSDRIVVLDGDGEEHTDYKAANHAKNLLEDYRDQPFFLACGFQKPHSPPTAPQRFFDLYQIDDMPLPVDFEPRVTTPPGFPADSVTKSGDLFVDRDATPEAAREMIRAYWASTSWTDWNVGRVLAELDRLKLREKTIIVLWGDHGYHLGEKGKWSKHGSLFEIGTRVPLMISVPGMATKGRRSPRIVEALDIYPTLCELCGLTIPAGLEGNSLRPLLNDPQAAWSHPAISVHGTKQNVQGAAIRTEKYRYVEFDADRGAMLFDESADPHEQKNLANDPAYKQTRDELAELLHKVLPPIQR